MESKQGKVQIIEIEDNSSKPAPVLKLPVTTRRRRSVPYLEKVEDVKSPKKLSSSNNQEEKKNDFLGCLL